ncbi:GNAT family N-acetyltransferase [Pseudoxanthomonas sp.]|uniref:GNAT family N-acetyltransferase n=1 Tax=Pseudoxanthomonas sp. TaxID=1871049 RepID=UPI0031F2EF3C
MAVLDYQLRDGRLLITHTGVPEALRGQGIAAALTHAAMGYARAQGFKVVPACAYAAAFVRRHPEYATLVAASAD